MALGGLALKSISFFLRLIQFCCAAIILGIFSYFIATLHHHGMHISTYVRAVEGLSGLAVLYTLFALLLVWCLGGIAIFSALGMILDLCFTGTFIYLAYATRAGRRSCRGNTHTPFGNGITHPGNTVPHRIGGGSRLLNLHRACKLETACFAFSLIGLFFFLFSLPLEFFLMRHRHHERAYGPSPNNGYTAGSSKRKFWERKPRRDNAFVEKNPDTSPTNATPADVRNSYATDTTAVGAGEGPVNKYGNSAPYGNATGNF